MITLGKNKNKGNIIAELEGSCGYRPEDYRSVKGQMGIMLK